MPHNGPQVYHRLEPFRELFRAGLPILTWHKLGPRPSGVRLKGLYLSAALFSRQLSELHDAGFVSASLDEFSKDAIQPAATRPNSFRIILTFDDGYANVLNHGLEPLAQAHFHAIQFLVADRLGQRNQWDLPEGEVQEKLMDIAEIKSWLAAGHQIGSHTLSHPFLTKVKSTQAREEIFSSKKKLEDLFARRIDHFCYPYGDWNPAVRDWVAEAGYRTACTTEFGVNTGQADALALRRITARYPSRNWKALNAWFRGLIGK